MDFINTLLPKLQGLGLLSYWIVLLITMAESLAFVGLVVPGTLFTVLAGFLAANGTFDLGDVIWFAAAGAIIGDGISFYLGRQGMRFFSPEGRWLKRHYLEKGERFFRKHGGKSVFLGRFIGPIRPIIPFVAGLVNMRKRDFFIYNITSAFAWSVSFILLGYFFGGIWKTIVLWSTRAELFFLVLFLIVAVFSLFKWLVIKKGKRFFLVARSVGVSIKQAFFENEEIKQLSGRFPSFFGFLKKRFQRGDPAGLSLTLGAAICTYLIFLFFGILGGILKSGTVAGTDVRVENLIFIFRNPFFLSLFTWVSLLGAWYVVIVFALLLSVFLWLWNKRGYIFLLWITLAGSQLFASLSKMALHRTRPATAFYLLDSYSFPSGHTVIATAFYGFLVYVIWKTSNSWNKKVNALFLGLIIALSVGFSRLYLGVHYLSDVAAGYLLGFFWLVFSVNIFRWIFRPREEKSIFFPANIVVVSSVLLFAGLAWFIFVGVFYRPETREVKLKKETKIIVQDPLEIFSSRKLSRYSEKLSGLPQEPISFVVEARDDEELIGAFENAGWYLADPPNAQSLLHIASSVILNQSYPSAPITPSFWNGQVNDFGFEKPTNKDSARTRHHARFWKTGIKTEDEKNIYMGVASLDIGIKYVVAHTISPDIDTEREFVFADLKKTGAVLSFRKEPLVDPVLGKNAAGDQFFTDGETYVVDIKN